MAVRQSLYMVYYYSTQLIDKSWNEDREDHDVDIFNIIRKVQDTVVHLEVDEEQGKITQGSKRQAQWVWSPRAMSCLYGSQILLIMHKKQQRRSTRLDRKHSPSSLLEGDR